MADDHLFDRAPSGYQQGQGAANLASKLRGGASQFLGDQEITRNSPSIETLEGGELPCLQSAGLSVD
jgi:hypothetical protein